MDGEETGETEGTVLFDSACAETKRTVPPFHARSPGFTLARLSLMSVGLEVGNIRGCEHDRDDRRGKLARGIAGWRYFLNSHSFFFPLAGLRKTSGDTQKGEFHLNGIPPFFRGFFLG